MALVFGSQILDRFLLLAMDPTGEDDDVELPRLKNEVHERVHRGEVHGNGLHHRMISLAVQRYVPTPAIRIKNPCEETNSWVTERPTHTAFGLRVLLKTPEKGTMTRKPATADDGPVCIRCQEPLGQATGYCAACGHQNNAIDPYARQLAIEDQWARRLRGMRLLFHKLYWLLRRGR